MKQELYKDLLAKSKPSDPQRDALTLAQHCCDAETAAQALFGLHTRWGQNWCRFFGLRDPERFLLNLRIAALFHDLGKANEDFQQAVQESGFYPQAVRHEHLSALVLCLPEVRNWLATNPALDVDAITAAVLSHHLKAASAGDRSWCQPHGSAKSAIALFLDHPDVAAIFAKVRDVAGLPPPPPLPDEAWSNAPPWDQAWAQGTRHAQRFRRALRNESDRLGLTLALKAGVIAADSAASGLVRTGKDIRSWIDGIANSKRLTASDLRDKIIAPRGDSIAKQTGTPFVPHTFQERVAELGSRALLIAGCGSGKTLAAWMWAERQLAEHRLGHVLFLYPTRGTATEGFRDYVSWAPENEAALVQSTASYELEEMRKNPSEAMGDKRFIDEEQERLFALGLWPRRWFSATVDQFLAFLSHRYESLCLLPLLADSAVILDEIHSYDRAMFRSLVSFLTHFDVPVLCMTATLPRGRKEQLQQLKLRVYPDIDDRPELRDLKRVEEHPRYRLHRRASVNDVLESALAAARAGKRVLCVVNTVQRCQDLAVRIDTAVAGTVPVLVYHSRYCLRDRHDRHTEVVEKFRRREDGVVTTPGVVAVTTQVCEMSLDLDADVLITELAPVPSLVQRCGRANRHLTGGERFRADIFVCDPEGHRPYDHDDLKLARTCLDALGVTVDGDGVEFSQYQLALAIEEHSRPEPWVSNRAPFLTGGYYAVSEDFRDIDDFTVPCVLDKDIAAIEDEWRTKGAPMRGQRRNLDKILPGYELSVPRRWVVAQAAKPEWLPRHLSIAPGDRYSEDLGFLVGETAHDE